MPMYYVFVPVANPTYRTRPQERVELTAVNEHEAFKLAELSLSEAGFNILPDAPPEEKFGLRKFVVEAGCNEHHRIEIDIFAIEGLKDLPTEGNGYCTSYSREHPNRKTYTDWEKEVATPALEAAGFVLTWCWCDGEADSFGPLSRMTTAVRDGKHYEISYG